MKDLERRIKRMLEKPDPAAVAIFQKLEEEVRKGLPEVPPIRKLDRMKF